MLFHMCIQARQAQHPNAEKPVIQAFLRRNAPFCFAFSYKENERKKGGEGKGADWDGMKVLALAGAGEKPGIMGKMKERAWENRCVGRTAVFGSNYGCFWE